MENRESFQIKLKKMVLHKLVTLVGIGVVLLAIGMLLAVLVTNYNSAKDNGKLYEDRFLEIYHQSYEFLSNPTLQDLCKKVLLYEEDTSQIPLNAKVVLSDKERNIKYCSFNDSEWDFYRNSFNKAICANAFGIPEGEVYTSVYYFDGNNSNYVMSKPVYGNHRTIGYINLYIEEEGWEECLYDAECEGVITDRRGRVIYSSKQSFITGINQFELTSKSHIVMINGSRYWQNTRYLDDGNVIIYSLVYYPRNSTLMLTVIGVIVIMGICWFKLADDMTEAMAKSNSSSIHKLVSQIQIISEGNAEYRINVDTQDEFSIVGIQINQMLDNIHELNQKNTELLRVNNVTEINHLTAQINPHFLYNTLEIIRNLLVFDNKRADSLIIKLTQILRYSINNNRKDVYLEEDMSYIKDYLDIQKSRFEDNLVYEIDIKEECNKCIVPKLILQPLIENSIKHGFRKKMNIHIWIEGHIEENYLLLSVKDDGEGMTNEEAESLQKIMFEPVSVSEHNGLHNIARRLFLQYGMDSGIEIHNLESKGLCVLIKIRLD